MLATLWQGIWEWIKGLFGSKGAVQIGSRNISVSGVTAGDGSNVIFGHGNTVLTAAPRIEEPAFEPTAEEKAILTKLAAENDSFLMYTNNDLGPILSIGAELFDPMDNSARVPWIEAFERLAGLGLINDMYRNGSMFNLSTAGRAAAAKLLASK